MVFFGELGQHSGLLKDYFLSYPSCPPIADGMNPATWMLDVIGAGTGGGGDFDFANAYRQSKLSAVASAHIHKALEAFRAKQLLGASSSHLEIEAGAGASKATYQTSWRTQVRWLMWRNLIVYCEPHTTRAPLPHPPDVFQTSSEAMYRCRCRAAAEGVQPRMLDSLLSGRSPTYSLIRFIITGFFMLVVGSLYFQIKVQAVADVQSLVMVIGFVLQFLGIYNMFVVGDCMLIALDCT